MNGISRKAVFAVAGFALVLALATGGAGAQSAAMQGVTAKPAEEVYKNIQVLQGMPAHQVTPTMQFIAASLGVDCEYCHVFRKRDLDVRPAKLVARKMMRMVAAMNNNTFDGSPKVTCYTCHRGSLYPVGMPLVASQESQPESAVGGASPGAMPTADQLLDKYIAALGGANAIQKISSRAAKGTVTDIRGRKLPVEILAQAPAKRLSVTRRANGDSTSAYNGDVGWNGVPGGPTRGMRRAQLDSARLEDPLYFAGQMKQVFSNLRVEGTEKVGGREAYVVSGRTQALPLVKLYFDKESGMLARLVLHTETALGRFPTQIDYADYRTADGVKIPFRWTIDGIMGNRSTYQMDEVQQNIPVEESKFAHPPAPAAAR